MTFNKMIGKTSYKRISEFNEFEKKMYEEGRCIGCGGEIPGKQGYKAIECRACARTRTHCLDNDSPKDKLTQTSRPDATWVWRRVL